MSGHSKWASIKHKKGAADAKRGKLFTKLARAISIAARDGGGDPDGNPSLALAIQKAKDQSMPKDNIQRAIDRGTGEGADASLIESITYEGYGPGGAAILVAALTDNRNRTGSEVRNLFDRSGGNLGEPNSVAWQFTKRGVIVLDGEKYGEDDLMAAIEAGAEDVKDEGDVLRVITEATDLFTVRKALEESDVEVQTSELTMEPQNTVEISEKEVGSLLRLVDALEDHDDVDAVYANFDVSDEILEKLSAEA